MSSLPVHSEDLKINSWRDLDRRVSLEGDDVSYFSFKTDNGSSAHLVVLNTKAKKLRIRPIVNMPGATTSATFLANKQFAVAAVNGGYFNLSNGLSTSYILLDGKVVCDPNLNPALVGNPKLLPFMPQILDRTEVRVYASDKNGLNLQISKHNEPLCKGKVLRGSLQAGPRLLPDLTARQEAFVRTESDGKEVDSIGSNRPAARTAFGITRDGHAMLLCIASSKQDEFSEGVTLSQLASLLKRLGCSEAINFDGGTSTTMVTRSTTKDDSVVPNMVCGRTPETHVKSVLLVEWVKP